MNKATKMALLMALTALAHALHTAQGTVHNVPLIALLGELEQTVDAIIPQVLSA